MPTVYISYRAVASAPIHAFLEFFLPVLRTIFFQSLWLFSLITIVETMDSGERGMYLQTTTYYPKTFTFSFKGQNTLWKKCWLPAPSPFLTMLSGGIFLTLFHIILAFNDPEKEALRKHCGKMLVTSIFSFSCNFFIHPKKNFCF